MIKIAISEAAFDAIATTLPLGSVGYENEVNERGERLIWLDPAVVSRLRAMRVHGESFRDVILRLASESVLGASGRSRIVENLRIRLPPIGRAPRQLDFADQSKARERCGLSTSIRCAHPKYECAGRSDPRLLLPFRIGEGTRRN